MRIQDKQYKTSEKSGKSYVQFTIDGKKYNSFNKEWNDSFNAGDIVDFKTEVKNGFTNLVELNHLTEDISSPQPSNESKHDIVITRVEKPHSYEFGQATSRHKIYYNEVSELKAHIDMLKEAGLLIQDII